MPIFIYVVRGYTIPMHRRTAVRGIPPGYSQEEPGKDRKAAGRRGGMTVRFRYLRQKNA